MTHSPDAYILHLAQSLFHRRPKRSAAHGHTGTYPMLPASPCAYYVFRFGSNNSEDGLFSGAARRHARGVSGNSFVLLLRGSLDLFFPILTPLILPIPFPNRLDCEQSAKGPTARRARNPIAISLERYALPPARAALRERVSKQRHYAALAAGPHALTLP